MVCEPDTCDKECRDHGAMVSEVKHIKEDIDELKDHNRVHSDIKGRVQILETRAANTGTIVGTSILVLITLFSALFAFQMNLQGKLENLTSKVYEMVIERGRK
jgi:hypothetical protein